MALLADLRVEYHRSLFGEVLGARDGSTVYNIADSGSPSSVAIAARMVELIGQPTCPNPLPGQTAGNEFTRITLEFLEIAFRRLDHVRPGSWRWAMNPSETNIALFEQYGHLSELKRILEEHKDLTTAFASDYIVRPDIIIAREPIEDYQLNEHDELVAIDDRAARHAPLRAANEEPPILHASISCKYTMRSDRAQNTRTEALNLIRNRKGRNPHIVAVTMEPMAGRIASIALGTGDIDCTYHGALDELLQATEDLGYDDAQDTLKILIEGRRLRDISDLPLDLAT
jgi:NgoMIV restriction enzyme